MFMSRLSGAPIGLTAFNMFVVNKPTILTVSTESQEKVEESNKECKKDTERLRGVERLISTEEKISLLILCQLYIQGRGWA